MQDYLSVVFVQLRNYRLCRNVVFQYRLSSNDLCDYLAVCFVDIEPFVISQEVQRLNQSDISACRWHPVVLYHIAAEFLGYFCKALQTDVDNLWLVGEHLHQLFGRCGYFALSYLLRTSFLLFRNEIVSDCLKCSLCSQHVGLRHDYAGFLQLCNGFVVTLEVVSGSAYFCNEEYISVLSSSLFLQALYCRNQCSGHVFVRTVSQYHVEQDDTGAWIVHSLFHALYSGSRIDHWMRLTLCVNVIAQVDYHVAVCVQLEAFLMSAILQSQCFLDQHCRFSGQSTAGIVCLDGLLVFLLEEPASVAINSSLFYLLSSYQAYCQTSTLVQRIGLIESFFVVFRLLAQEQAYNRLLANAQSCSNLIGYFLCRWFGDNNQHLNGLILFHGIDYIQHCGSAYLCRQISAAGSDCVGNALAQTVNDGGQFLNSGTGCTDDSDGTRINGVGKSNRNALDDSGSAVRSHNNQALLMCLILNLLLIFDGYVVGEHEHVHVFVQCSLRFQCGICTRNGNNCQVGIRHLSQSLIPGLCSLSTLLLRIGTSFFCEVLVYSLHQCVQNAFLFHVCNDYHVVRSSCHQLFCFQAALLEDVLVRRSCHHDGNLVHTLNGGNFIGQKHQSYRIVIASGFNDCL